MFTLIQRIIKLILSALRLLIIGVVFTWGLFWYLSGSPLGLWQYLYTYFIASHYAMEAPSKEALFDGSLHGMLEGLDDPYSAYMNSAEYQSVVDTVVNSSYGGVGIVVSEQNGPIVVAPIEDSPAYKAGIKAGDRITAVDGKTTLKTPLGDVSRMLRGEPGTEVVLSILRDGKEQQITIVRENIKIPTVRSKMLDSGIGLIRIRQFAKGTGEEFAKQYEELKAQGMKKLVLDLRSNPGGLVDEAQKVGDYILPKGPMVSIKSRYAAEEIFETKGLEPLMPMVILIDGGSASASEIIAGAAQDYGVATLIGQKSFGKGTVQVVIPGVLGDGYKVSIARYHTPKGRVIDKIGIVPDIAVDAEEGPKALKLFQNNENGESDLELAKALEVLRAK